MTQTTRTLLSRLVGAYHRPPAQLLLDNLPVGTKLLLDPEPDNPYDQDAIKVLLKREDFPEIDEEELVNFGWNKADLYSLLEPLHLGYIAKSGGKPADGLPGNAEVLEMMAGSPNWSAELTFTPEGKPCVKVTEN